MFCLGLLLNILYSALWLAITDIPVERIQCLPLAYSEMKLIAFQYFVERDVIHSQPQILVSHDSC